MEFSNPFNTLQMYEEATMDSEMSMTLYQPPATPKGKKCRVLSSPEKICTPTPVNTFKSMLLKAKTLIERAMKEETDHANKANLESAILNLQIALGQKPRKNDINIKTASTTIENTKDSIEATWNRKLDQLEHNVTAKLEKMCSQMESKLGKHPYPTTSYPTTSQTTSQTTNGQTMNRTPSQIFNQVTDQIDQRPTYADIAKNPYKSQKPTPPTIEITKGTNVGSHIEVDSPIIPTSKPWVVITKKS
jgi:hypothetical protein